MKCRLCASERMLSVLDLGAVPPSDRFLTFDELDLPETSYPLHLRLCESCLLLQVPAYVMRDDMAARYPAPAHELSDADARSFFNRAIGDFALGSHSSIVQIGSRDGYLLRHAVEAGIPCLGIEPSANAGTTARALGVPTVTGYFDEGMAEDLYQEYGAADLIVANNMYSHVSDVEGFARALRTLVADYGRISIEVDHALHLVRDRRFDTIDHARLQYYTILTAMRALASGGLTVFDVEPVDLQGDSIRIWARPEEVSAPPGPRVDEILEEERAAGLHTPEGYRELEAHARATRSGLLRFLLDCQDRELSVIGYGTGCYSTVLNYCGIRPDLMSYTVDHDPFRQGCYTSGTRMPVCGPEQIRKDHPDVVVVLPWGPVREPADHLQYIDSWGGRLVFPAPAARTPSAQPYPGLSGSVME
ncbi:class I SAM-dependent methyltransferase [Rhodococcus chondri]|uniref:Class I SAM-dependent methyltransferase n=1 Tax=Rhodococcus chondri TaxID=3065941 RepID=A0ABU7JNN7_9NOCA|nr:class I SAM-dependent methyltransferase [Rhodococcus sp. CC-R104]MEE2031646.1 class I SAM-dependent methyltransferase [Rhodococcus sp. CC-R104]